MARSDKLYKDSPTTERDEESGKVAVKKKKPEEKKADANKQGTVGDGEPMHAGIEPHARHAMERLAMHAKHENEHHAHDAGKHGDKKEMHARHQKEMADMHKRHDKELTKGADSTELKPESEAGNKGEKKKEGAEEGSAKEKKKD